MKDFRIRKYDGRNWVIERFSPAELQTKGPLKGKMSKPTWVNEGYYGKLQDIPNAILEKSLHGAYDDVQSILKEIKRAEKQILRCIEKYHKEIE